MDNAAGDTGGGASGGTLTNCALIGNRASRGGGVWGCTLVNCTIANSIGGGARGATLYNSMLVHVLPLETPLLHLPAVGGSDVHLRFEGQSGARY